MAEMLLAQALAPRAKLELPGTPFTLLQAMEQTSGTQQRERVVQAYWKLVGALCAHHYAVDDRAALASISTRQLAGSERAALAAAQAGAEAAVVRTERNFVVAQHELAVAGQLSDVHAQPIPSDVPLVGAYRTHFAALYGSGAAPAGLRRLDREMPYQLRTLRAAADAASAAQQALEAAISGVNAGETTMAGLLEIARLNQAARSEFHNAVQEYNERIAAYALQAAPHPSPAKVVGMLIKTKPAVRSAAVPTQTAVPRSVSRTSAETPIAADTHPRFATTHDDDVGTSDTAPARFSTPRQPVRYQIAEEGEVAQPDFATEDVQPKPSVAPVYDASRWRND